MIGFIDDHRGAYGVEPIGKVLPIVFGRLHLLPVVTQFRARYPEIDIRLMLSDRFVDLVGDHVDIALRIVRFRTATW